MNLRQLKQNRLLRFIFYPLLLVKRIFIRKSFERAYANYDRVMELVRNETLDLELRDFEGVFSLNKNSTLTKFVIKEGGYEPELAECVKQSIDREKDAIDIGANVGFFSVLFGKTLGSNSRVLSVEPTPGALKNLKSNLERNGIGNSIVFEGALSKETGELEFNQVVGHEEYSSIQNIAHQNALGFETETIKVKCETLDSLVEKHGLQPGFIKMDVEGAEWEVIQGAKETLEKYKPSILTELDDQLLRGFGTNSESVCSYLESLGYELCDPESRGPVKYGLSTSVLAVAIED